MPETQKARFWSQGQEDPWVRSRKWQPTPVFLPGKFHGPKSLAGYNPWSCKELDRTEPLKGNAKECSNCRTIALISHASKVILKILQARLQQDMNHEIPDVQAEFRKGRGTRDQIAKIHCIIKKQESSRKASALLTMPKPLTVWITTNCGKF